jgi:hypothetical protein
MKPFPVAALVALTGLAVAQTSGTARAIAVPREKVSLICTDDYFKQQRINYLLQDETYSACRLKLPLALKERWPGRRTFYLIPRLSASLLVKDKDNKSAWLPLSPLTVAGSDPLHGTLDSRGYQAVELVGRIGKLSDVAGTKRADTVGAGGKLTVCVAPVLRGEAPCVTFDVTARFGVYLKN